MAALDPSRLEALLESAALLHASLDLDELLRHLLRSVMGRLLVTRALVAVASPAGMQVTLARGVPGLPPGSPFDEPAGRAAGVDVVLPIGPPEEPVGLLALGHPPAGRLEEEADFIRALLGMAASGIANARSHAEAARLAGELGQKVQELRTLIDLVRGFAATQEPDEVAQLLALTLAGRWTLSRYAVTAWMPGHPPVVRQRGIRLADPRRFDSIVPDLPEVLTPDDLPADEEWRELREQNVRLVLPIRSAAVRGLVALGPRAGGLAWDETGHEFGAALVAQAAVAFENAWRFRETLSRKRVEQELALAASIQQGLFPAAMPALAGYDLAAFNRPASQVGGDYYDTFVSPLDGPPASCLLCVADVSGKGLPASLLMSTIQASLRALRARTTGLVDLTTEINELLYATTPGNKYATAVLFQFDARSGRATYVSAGHARCLVARADGRVEPLEPCGPPVGLLTGLEWEEKGLDLEPGDTLALFSDGVTEAWNGAEEEFGEDRIVAALRESRRETAAAAVARVVAAIDRFAAGAPQHDDITLLVARRTG